MNNLLLEKLKNDVELLVHKKILTAKDFENLSDLIFNRLNIYLSATTLKRIWGYNKNENSNPRITSLNILARFLGYRDWSNYLANSTNGKKFGSSPIIARKVNVLHDLLQGDIVRLSWLPDRICIVRYLGNLEFIVIDSENTRLREGDRFMCSVIIEDEPLYLDRLVQNDAPPIAYLCGNDSGIRFEVLKKI